jgi:hypothetical protein
MTEIIGRSDESFDPYKRLVVGIFWQAVTDLRHWRSNPVRAFDASVWLLSDDATLLVEGALGMRVEDDYLEALIADL